MDAAGLGWSPPRIGFAVLVSEDGDQPAIAGIEVEMAFGRPVEIGLLEYEGHTEQPLPEINRNLTAGSREGDVVYTLALQLLHGVHRELNTAHAHALTSCAATRLGRHLGLVAMPHRTGLRRLGQGGSNLQACHHLTAERVAIIAAAVGASASGAMAGLP